MNVDVLNTPIEFLKGVGPKRADLLKSEMSIYSFRDLLNHFPFRYVDRSKTVLIKDIVEPQGSVQISVQVSNVQELGQPRKKRLLVSAFDASGSVQLVWFKGVKWIKPTIKLGQQYVIFGKPTSYAGSWNFNHPEMELEEKSKNKQGKLIVFSAPSGSGKTTIVRHLLGVDNLNLEFSISATSREKRGEEAHGKDYYFLSAKEFKNKIKSDAFLEWEEVYRDNFYGTLKTEVERIWALGKNVIFDIDVSGGLRIKRKYPEQTLAVFVKPPSIDALKIRLKKRKTESEDKINMRVAKASAELATAPLFDTIIVNDNLDEALIEAEKKVGDFINS